MPTIECPIDGHVQMDRVWHDTEAGTRVEEVYVPAVDEDQCSHQLTVVYADPVVEGVQDAQTGEDIPRSKWGDA